MSHNASNVMSPNLGHYENDKSYVKQITHKLVLIIKAEKYRTNSHRLVREPRGAWIPDVINFTGLFQDNATNDRMVFNDSDET